MSWDTAGVRRGLWVLHAGGAGLRLSAVRSRQGEVVRRDAAGQSRGERQREVSIPVRLYRLVRRIRRALCAWGAWVGGRRLEDIALVRRSKSAADNCLGRRLPCGRR